MKKTEDHITNTGKSLGLSSEEKRLMKGEFLAFLEQQTEPSLISTSTASPYFLFLKHGSLVAGLLLVIMTTSVSASAELSQPGDTLYHIKINVNEKVFEALSVTPAQKVKLHTELATRRLEEAEALVTENKSDSVTLTGLKEKIRQHSNEALKTINNLKESGDAEAGIEAARNLQAVLEAHEDILEEVDEKNVDTEEDEKVFDDLQNDVKTQGDTAELWFDEHTIQSKATSTREEIHELLNELEEKAEESVADIKEEAEKKLNIQLDDTNEE